MPALHSHTHCQSQRANIQPWAINAINWLYIKTDFLPFEIKERQIFEQNDNRFEKWSKQLESTDQHEDVNIFYQSIF
jgi:hypothetical protein